MLRSPRSTVVESVSATRAWRRGAMAAAVALSALTGTAFAQDGGVPTVFDIARSVQAGGGGNSAGGDFALAGTIGQVVAGPMQGGDFEVLSGYVGAEGAYCERADCNCDGSVDGADLGLLLMNWGPCLGGGNCVGDINVDGHVDGEDLGLLLAHWG